MLLARVITRADRLCAAYCNFPLTDSGIRTLESADYTVYPQPHAEYPRALDHGLVNVTAWDDLFVSEDWSYSVSEEITTASYVVIDNERRVLWLTPLAPHAWSESPRANKVKLTAGFVATPSGNYSTAPDDIVELVAAAVRHLWDLRQTQGTISTNKGEHSVQRDQEDARRILPASVQEGLAPYVRWRSRVY